MFKCIAMTMVLLWMWLCAATGCGSTAAGASQRRPSSSACPRSAGEAQASASPSLPPLWILVVLVVGGAVHAAWGLAARSEHAVPATSVSGAPVALQAQQPGSVLAAQHGGPASGPPILPPLPGSILSAAMASSATSRARAQSSGGRSLTSLCPLRFGSGNASGPVLCHHEGRPGACTMRHLLGNHREEMERDYDFGWLGGFQAKEEAVSALHAHADSNCERWHVSSHRTVAGLQATEFYCAVTTRAADDVAAAQYAARTGVAPAVELPTSRTEVWRRERQQGLGMGRQPSERCSTKCTAWARVFQYQDSASGALLWGYEHVSMHSHALREADAEPVRQGESPSSTVTAVRCSAVQHCVLSTLPSQHHCDSHVTPLLPSRCPPHTLPSDLLPLAVDFVQRRGDYAVTSDFWYQVVCKKGINASSGACATALTTARDQIMGPPPPVQPDSVSILQNMANASAGGDLIIGAKLFGPTEAFILRSPRKETDTSPSATAGLRMSPLWGRGLLCSPGWAAAHWLDTPGRGMLMRPDSQVIVISDDASLRGLEGAPYVHYDTAFQFAKGFVGNNAALGAILTRDKATNLRRCVAILVLSNDKSDALVAGLHIITQRCAALGFSISASVLVHDNNYTHFAAFCFAWSSILYQKLCLWHIVDVLTPRILSESFTGNMKDPAIPLHMQEILFLVNPWARAQFRAGSLTFTEAAHKSCNLVTDTLVQILKLTDIAQTLAALEAFFMAFKQIPGLLDILQSPEYNDLYAASSCFLDVPSTNG